MQQFQNSVQDSKGNALPALIQVTFLGTSNLAPIFSDNGSTPKGNPFTADATGEYRFYAANGRYTITVTYKGDLDRVYDALMYDPVDSPLTAQALKDELADTTDPDNGDALLGVKQPFPNATGRTQHSKNAEVVSALDFGALGNGTGDDRPAIQKAIDDIAAAGGGVVWLPAGCDFRLASTTSRTVFDTVGGFITLIGFLFLPANVSLIGAGSAVTRIFAATGGASGGIVTILDPSNNRIAGLELQGLGGSSNAVHGIFVFPLTTYDFVMENVSFDDLYIHDVGSYGIGNQLQCRGVSVSRIKTRNTGSDGIDWKIRGMPGTEVSSLVSEAVFFSKIDIDAYGQRVGAGTPSGFGVRGIAHIDQISVKGISGEQPGIDFVAGVSTSDEARKSASFSTITNWYCEGADPKADVIGLRSYACEGVRVGPGIAKWCRLVSQTETPTPYGFDDGPVFEGSTVIPAHGRTAYVALTRGTHFKGARIISDKFYWSDKRGNLVPGQTVLPLPYDTTTTVGSARFLVKKTASTWDVLVEGVDYTWGANFATIAVPAAAGEQYFSVFPPARGFRIEAESCSVDGIQDIFVPSRLSSPTQAINDASTIRVVWEGHQNINQLPSPNVLGFIAGDPHNVDAGLIIHAQGAGPVVLSSSVNSLRFFGSSGGALKQTVTGAKGGNAALTSLLAALSAYGLIVDGTT